MKNKMIIPLVIIAAAFLVCIGSVCNWPYTERLYLTLTPSADTSEEFEGMSKSDKLFRISDEDIADYKYIREGLFPIDYTPNYIPLILASAGAGASLTAMLSMFLDFYIAKRRIMRNGQRKDRQ